MVSIGLSARSAITNKKKSDLNMPNSMGSAAAGLVSSTRSKRCESEATSIKIEDERKKVCGSVEKDALFYYASDVSKVHIARARSHISNHSDNKHGDQSNFS